MRIFGIHAAARRFEGVAEAEEREDPVRDVELNLSPSEFKRSLR